MDERKRNDYKTKIDSVLYGYYPKYETLFSLCKQYGICENVNGYIDIYIDLYDMLRNLYGTTIYADKEYTIVSSVVNLAAHMREFFWSRFKVNTRIYLVYANQTSNTHRLFYPNFGGKDISQFVGYERTDEIIATQLKLVQILCAYFHGIYYVERSCDFAIFTHNSITKNMRKSVVLTKSKYAYQIPANWNNVYLIRPKKYKGVDESFCITRDTLFVRHMETTNESQIQQMKTLDPSLYSLLLTLTNLPARKVTSLLNKNTALNLLSKAVEEQKIINGYNSDISYVYNALQPILQNKIDEFHFRYRFQAIDLVYQRYLYTTTAESKDASYLIDLEDKAAVQTINNTYFADNPLNLEWL